MYTLHAHVTISGPNTGKILQSYLYNQDPLESWEISVNNFIYQGFNDNNTISKTQ